MHIAITRPLPGDPIGMLRAAGFEDVWINPRDERLTPQEFRDAAPGANAILTTPMDRVDGALLDAAGPQLKIVSNYAVGYDNIDVVECRRRGVIVGNTPGAVTEPTADITWLLLLGAARRAREGIDLIRSGTWSGVAPNQLLGTRLGGKTLFILGAGRIGTATARRAPGFNVTVIYTARSRRQEIEAGPVNAAYVSLEEGLSQADFVSIHVPLNAETRHLINRERIALMNPSAILVNTSRGGVIDEGALVEALRERRIAAAGLDVFENEPALHPGLADLPNVFLLPHLGSATREDREWMMRLAVENIIAALRGEPVPHSV
jgi:glyoxylate reductase